MEKCPQDKPHSCLYQNRFWNSIFFLIKKELSYITREASLVHSTLLPYIHLTSLHSLAHSIRDPGKYPCTCH